MSHTLLYTIITLSLMSGAVSPIRACASLHYKEQATQWVHRYVLTSSGTLALSTHDTQHLMNLLYYSYQRSMATVDAQLQALPILDSMWKSWQNIAQTRMNPSRTRPYHTLSSKQIAALHTYIATQDSYHKAQEAYATVSNLVVKGAVVQSLHLKDGIKELRTAARKVVSHALLDVKNHVTKLSNYISTKKIIDEGVHTKTNMRDFFTTYIPQLAVTSFVETEHGANALSDESWQVLFGMQKISSYVWQTLEQRRADFYRAYYQELYRALQKFDAHNTFFTSIINGNEKLPQLNDCPSNKNGVSLNLHELEFYSN